MIQSHLEDATSDHHGEPDEITSFFELFDYMTAGSLLFLPVPLKVKGNLHGP
jgi:hypothetical protein